MLLSLNQRANRSCPLNHQTHHFRTGGSTLLKVLVGAGLEYLLFTNPGARQITADALRAAADALAPEQEETSSPNGKKSINEAKSPIDDHYSHKQAAQ